MFAGPREGARERKGILKTFLSSFFYTFLGAYSSRVNRKCCANSHTPPPHLSLSLFLFFSFKSLAYVSMCISFYFFVLLRFPVSFHIFSHVYTIQNEEKNTTFIFFLSVHFHHPFSQQTSPDTVARHPSPSASPWRQTRQRNFKP